MPFHPPSHYQTATWPLPLHGRQIHIQGNPVPEGERALPLDPVLAVVCQLHVEVVHDARQDQTHLRIGQAEGSKFRS